MTDRDYMKRAIELARLGTGWTSPNPMVGAVAVKNGRIIAEDYHHRYGEFHAERNSLMSCGKEAEGAVLYVTLEPCCHYGKTPPCTDIIIEKKIKRVVIGSRDPNPLISGRGVRILREHGIEVTEDFMREECDALNTVFFHYIQTGEPYTVMKFAMTLDGKIAAHTGLSRWISGEAARQHVHKERARYSSIMAGIGTVLADDPMLNARLEGAHQPLRVICDSRLRIPEEGKICRTAGSLRTVAACALDESDFENNEKAARLEALGIEVWNLPYKEKSPDEYSFGKNTSDKTKAHRVDLGALKRRLGKDGIDSIYIEGGGTLNFAALRAGIVDHVCAYIAPKLMGGRDAKTPVEGIGVSAPSDAFMLKNLKTTMLGEDVLLEYDIKNHALKKSDNET